MVMNMVALIIWLPRKQLPDYILLVLPNIMQRQQVSKHGCLAIEGVNIITTIIYCYLLRYLLGWLAQYVALKVLGCLKGFGLPFGQCCLKTNKYMHFSFVDASILSLTLMPWKPISLIAAFSLCFEKMDILCTSMIKFNFDQKLRDIWWLQM